MVPVTIEENGNRLYFTFPFNRELMAEIKAMKGAKWHGYDDVNPRKVWSVTNCLRNRFQLSYLAGQNPYQFYDLELSDIDPNRPEVAKHQREFIAHLLQRKRCVLAARMGTGKTLAAIEAMEKSGFIDFAWIGPRSALAAVRLEFKKWKSPLKPLFYTYETMRNMMQKGEFHIPHGGVIFDEAQKIKNATSQRSVAAANLVEAIISNNPEAYIVLMSGTPAPKSPVDWWHICEVACPGFLREGDVNKFKNRLALIEEKQSITGGVYPGFITWFDDENKCKVCGRLPADHDGLYEDLTNVGGHKYERSVNEVKLLYKRMGGLVLVKFKEDCLGLPDMQYRKITLKPSQSLLRAAKLIKETAPRAVTAMMMQRELSDGFQYEDKVDGKTKCPRCFGNKTALEWFDPEHPDEYPTQEAMESGRCIQREEPCPKCKGTGEVDRIVRGVVEIPCPKEQVFTDLLEEHDDIGRFVTYAGFQASVDRLVKAALKFGWETIRADGRGWAYYTDNGPVAMSPEQMLEAFQDVKSNNNKLVFIGQAGAAGLGITLTASPSVFFYSNSFNNEDRTQAKDRIHRMGMDENRGATCIDVVHLPIDQYIIDNLDKKTELEEITMGRFKEELDQIEAELERTEDTYVTT